MYVHYYNIVCYVNVLKQHALYYYFHVLVGCKHISLCNDNKR